MHTPRIYIVILIGTLAVITAYLFVMRHADVVSPDGNPAIRANLPPAATTTREYQNLAHHFSLTYPQRDRMVDAANQNSFTWSNFSDMPGEPLVAIYLPEELSRGTNLVAAYVRIGVSTADRAVATCIEDHTLSSSTAPVDINGIWFHPLVATSTDASSVYEVHEYRVVHNQTCIALTAVMQTTPLANYASSSPVSVFSHDAILSQLNGIIDTFIFHD